MLRQTERNDHFPVRSGLALVVLALVAIGCGDSSAAPKAARSLSTAQPQLSRNDGNGSFSYDPDESITIRLGNRDHFLVIPAGGICDIGRSSYGPKYWDAPCAPENRRSQIEFKVWTDVNGHPFVEFKPALRFVPSKTVLLYLADSRASMNDYSEILYCPDNKALPCYDESLIDRSLKSVRDRSGRIYRRIKHFSGYNVAAGLDEMSDDARWSVSTTNGHAVAARGKKSGYMVVSGAESDQNDRH